MVKTRVLGGYLVTRESVVCFGLRDDFRWFFPPTVCAKSKFSKWNFEKASLAWMDCAWFQSLHKSLTLTLLYNWVELKMSSNSKIWMQKILSVVKVLLGSSVFFIPSELPYREVIAEGMYSLSQIVSLITDTMNSEIYWFSSIPRLMQLLGLSISNLEVFIESVTRFVYRWKWTTTKFFHQGMRPWGKKLSMCASL